jgi:hypothetical protein
LFNSYTTKGCGCKSRLHVCTLFFLVMFMIFFCPLKILFKSHCVFVLFNPLHVLFSVLFMNFLIFIVFLNFLICHVHAFPSFDQVCVFLVLIIFVIFLVSITFMFILVLLILSLVLILFMFFLDAPLSLSNDIGGKKSC